MKENLYDEAGDIPPTGGFREPERRRKNRRTDDRIQRDMESWVATLFVHRGKLVALASILTFLFTSLGFRILGPSQDIKALDAKFTAKDSIMNIRVSRIEDGQRLLLQNQQAMAESQRFLTYMACQSMSPSRRPVTCYANGNSSP